MNEVGSLISLENALGSSRKEVRERYREYVNPGLVSMMTLLDFDKRFVKASGLQVWDQNGDEYLDFLGGYGSLNMGHNPPRVIEAIQRVIGVPNILQASLNSLAAALAENIANITPGELKVSFFTNSGTETVESALKMARISTGKPRILFCNNSFHGKSFGSLSVTGRDKYRQPFTPTIPGCTKIEYDNLEAIEEQLVAGDVAAVIVEPIQGEGGIIVPKHGYLKGIRELCDKYGSLFIADEIQTGLGRTGKNFACQYEDVAPDIMCISKSLSGGMVPVGACVATEKVFKKAYGSIDRCLLHTSTFGGNSIAMAAGLAAVEMLVEERLAERAERAGKYLLDRITALKNKYPLVKEVRGKGLLIGIEFHSGQGNIIDKLSGGAVSQLGKEYIGAVVAGELLNKYRIITAYTLNNPNVIRLEPPLVVNDQQLDYMVRSLENILEDNKNLFKMVLSSVKSSVTSKLKGR